MELYQGFDTFSGKTKNTVIKPIEQSPSVGSQASLSISVAKSMEELKSSLEIDASMKVSYSVFSADAKSKYLHQLSLTTNSVVVLIYFNKKDTAERLNVEIPKSILSTLDTEEGVNEFVGKYGDSWVSKISKGAEFYVTFTFYSETKNEKEEIENSLSASGVVAGVSVNASLAVKIGNVLNTSNVEYKIGCNLSGYSHLSPPTMTTPDQYVQDLIDFAQSLFKEEPTKPNMISYELTPYEATLPPKVKFEKIRHNRELFNGNPGNQGWGEMIAQLIQVKDNCKEIKKAYKFYNNYKDDDLEAKLSQVMTDIDYMYQFVAKVDSHPNADHPFNIPKSLLYGLPRIDYSVLIPVDPGFLNGGGGGPYQDVKLINVPQQIHLNSIQVSHGSIVDMLIAKYTTKYPDNEFIQEHGTPGGTQSPELFLGHNEYIIEMGGWMNSYWLATVVGGMYVKTSKGNIYKTQDNADTLANQKWKAEEGDLLIGFSGSSGNNLDCIQPIVLRISPAIWDEFEFHFGSIDYRADSAYKNNVSAYGLSNTREVYLPAIRTSAVVNIPPDNLIYDLGRIDHTLHIYNTGNPGQQITDCILTIINIGVFDFQIPSGHSVSQYPNGNKVYIMNQGPCTLQVLF